MLNNFAKEEFPGDEKRRVILCHLGGIIALLICKASGTVTFCFIGITGGTAPETARAPSKTGSGLVQQKTEIKDGCSPFCIY